jgi:hypothetical protein
MKALAYEHASVRPSSRPLLNDPLQTALAPDDPPVISALSNNPGVCFITLSV